MAPRMRCDEPVASGELFARRNTIGHALASCAIRLSCRTRINHLGGIPRGSICIVQGFLFGGGKKVHNFSRERPQNPLKPEEKLAGVAGLEPVTSAVTGQRSNQLSYTPAR